MVNNNAGNGDVGLAKLIQLGRVKKIICSFPRQADSWHFDEKYHAGEIELEVVPQGNLAERIRAAGAGIGAFYTPTARNFGPIMAAAAKHSIVQVSEIVERGQIDPEVVVTPGIYVDTVVKLEAPQQADPREDGAA